MHFVQTDYFALSDPSAQHPLIQDVDLVYDYTCVSLTAWYR